MLISCVEVPIPRVNLELIPDHQTVGFDVILQDISLPVASNGG